MLFFTPMRSTLITLVFAVFLSGCIVHSHGRGRHGCGHGYRWNGHRCVATVHPKKKHKHGHGKKDTVIIRDHRR